MQPGHPVPSSADVEGFLSSASPADTVSLLRFAGDDVAALSGREVVGVVAAYRASMPVRLRLALRDMRAGSSAPLAKALSWPARVQRADLPLPASSGGAAAAASSPSWAAVSSPSSVASSGRGSSGGSRAASPAGGLAAPADGSSPTELARSPGHPAGTQAILSASPGSSRFLPTFLAGGDADASAAPIARRAQ